MSIKVVVWDLDNTVWDDVAVELPAGVSPTPRPDVLDAMRRLAAGGVVSSVASRSAPSVASLVAADPDLSSLVVAPQVGWQDKSRSLLTIASSLGVSVSSLLLVDDSGFERAEVESALPEVRTTDRDGLLAMVPSLLPEVVTPEAASRTSLYRAEAARRAAEVEHRDREAFLRSCDLRLTVAPAAPTDVPRVLELAERAHRLSSTALQLTAAHLDSHEVLVGRLTDRFGDHGLIALAVLDGPEVPLFAVSCRVAGRGAAEAFLLAVTRRTPSLRLPIRVTDANTELRLLVRQLGFTLTQTGPDTLVATAPDVLPAGPPWMLTEETT